MDTTAVRGRNYVLEKQPQGFDGVKYSLEKMVEAVRKARMDPDVIAWARRVQRDAGYPQTAIGRARAVFDGMKKQGIRWVPDPVKSEFIAAVKYFAPSDDGKDDALMVAGDCEELTNVMAGLYCAASQAVGVEDCALVAHSYTASRIPGHVLGGVHDGTQWVRVDPSSDEPFGWFKQPTHEIFVSLPSGRVLCSAASCHRTPPLPADPHDFEHGRLEGLGERLASASGTLAGLHTLGELDPGVLEAYQEILEGQKLGLAEAAERYDRARGALEQSFKRWNVPPEERADYWPPEADQAATELLDGAAVYVAAVDDVIAGRRRWAIDPDTNDYVIEQLPSDKKRVTEGGDVVQVFAGVEPEPPALGALPVPVAVALIVAGGIVVGLAAYGAIVEGLNALAKIAEEAEIRVANETLQKCLEKYDPERCSNLAKNMGEMRAAKAAEEASQEESKARATEARARVVVAVATVATVAAGAVVAWQTGLFALAKRKLQQRAA